MECESVRINASSFADSVSMGAPISGMRYFFRFFLLEAFINNWLNIDCSYKKGSRQWVRTDARISVVSSKPRSVPLHVIGYLLKLGLILS